MDVCTCGHSIEEHGGDPEYPGSTARSGLVLAENDADAPCDCIAYEEDEDAE